MILLPIERHEGTCVPILSPQWPFEAAAISYLSTDCMVATTKELSIIRWKSIQVLTETKQYLTFTFKLSFVIWLERLSQIVNLEVETSLIIIDLLTPKTSSSYCRRIFESVIVLPVGGPLRVQESIVILTLYDTISYHPNVLVFTRRLIFVAPKWQKAMQPIYHVYFKNHHPPNRTFSNWTAN